MIKEFNIIINGVGGQGLITLLQIIATVAAKQGYDVKTSELHGLAQRGGSVETHIRFGKKIYSPLVSQGRADLIISLEVQESLKGLYYASGKTAFLINQYRTPTFSKNFTEKEIQSILKKVSQNIFLIPASEICRKELANDVLAGIYLLGLSVSKKILPLKLKSIKQGISKIVPQKYNDINIKAFQLALCKP